MKTIIFDSEEAVGYGLHEAIVLHVIRGMIDNNRIEKMFYSEGRTWTRISVNTLEEHLPFMTTKQLRSTTYSLISNGVFIRESKSENYQDRTLWYAFKDESLWLKPLIFEESTICPTGQMGGSKRANAITSLNSSLTLTLREEKKEEERLLRGVSKNFLQNIPPSSENLETGKSNLDALITTPKNSELTGEQAARKFTITSFKPSTNFVLTQEQFVRIAKFRKSIGKSIRTEEQALGLVRKAQRYHDLGGNLEDAINESIANGWQGFFFTDKLIQQKRNGNNQTSNRGRQNPTFADSLRYADELDRAIRKSEGLVQNESRALGSTSRSASTNRDSESLSEKT